MSDYKKDDYLEEIDKEVISYFLKKEKDHIQSSRNTDATGKKMMLLVLEYLEKRIKFKYKKKEQEVL